MKKYKVEFKQTETFVIDVLADNEEEAKVKAKEDFYKEVDNNTLHYKQVGDLEVEIDNIYDVSNTDDPFNPNN